MNYRYAPLLPAKQPSNLSENARPHPEMNADPAIVMPSHPSEALCSTSPCQGGVLIQSGIIFAYDSQ